MSCIKLGNILLLIALVSSCSSNTWRTASRESAGITLRADLQKEDVFQVYYARAFSWKGYLAVHPWVSWKRTEDKNYTVAQVTSWNIRRLGSAISMQEDLPDRRWYDSEPVILQELKGAEARSAIRQAEILIKNYKYKDTYRVWPGPNSNTFVAHLLREIKELDLELPASAVGKDYLGATKFFANTASNTGFVFSAWGLLGLNLGLSEGAEVNVLGLHFGLDLWSPALKLPFVGRLGFKDL